MPGGPGIRLDGAVTTGNVISKYYDSLLSKVSSQGAKLWGKRVWQGVASMIARIQRSLSNQ